MCGIAGLMTRKESRGCPGRLEDALHRLRPRGPDAEGKWSGSGISLGMRRLSIIDLEKGGQPFFNETRRIVATVNGEIYNAPELRTELESRGHRFQGGSDCEVLVHLYEEEGESFLRRARGMFALVLWDGQLEKLLLGVDRFGEKPLVLAETPDCLCWASEIRAIPPLLGERLRVDTEAVQDNFEISYLPPPRTIFRGIRKLCPGTLEIWDRKTWDRRSLTYWSVEQAGADRGCPGSEGLAGLLEESGRITLRSDRPIGLALSGGLDSSLVSALAARGGKQIEAFTVGYPGEPENDERKGARTLANQLGIPLHECEIHPSEVADEFPHLLEALDEPVADIAAQGYRRIFQAAADRKIPVLLMGQGGDELSWGYDWIRKAVIETERAERLKQQPLIAWHEYLGPGTDGDPRWRKKVQGCLRNWLGLGRDWGGRATAERMFDLNPERNEARQLGKRLFSAPSGGAFGGCLGGVGRGPIRPDIEITGLICRTYLAGNGLILADRLGMACSVEARLPLLDAEWAEAWMACRRDFPDHALEPKARLREVARKLGVPAEVLSRQKRGFAPPGREWKRAILKRYFSWLPDGCLMSLGILSSSGLNILRKKHLLGARYTNAAYTLLVLEGVLRRYQSHLDFT